MHIRKGFWVFGLGLFVHSVLLRFSSFMLLPLCTDNILTWQCPSWVFLWTSSLWTKKLLLAMISGNTRCFSFQAHSFFHLFYGNMFFFFYNPTETHISVQRSLEEGHKISLSVLQQPCQAESNFQIIQADTTLETSIVYGLNGYLASVHFFPKLLQGPDPNKVW